MSRPSSLATQMENFFTSLAERLPGYESFSKESLAFKHCRLDVERRLQNGTDWVKTSDIAHLLELFQSALLKYWEYEPSDPDPERTENLREKRRQRAEEDKEERMRKAVEKKEEDESNRKAEKAGASGEEARATLRESRAIKAEEESARDAAAEKKKQQEEEADDAAEWKPPTKKIPVLSVPMPSPAVPRTLG